MLEFFRKLFASDFVPHGYCMRWSSDVVWLHVVSDGLITIAYYLIPFALVYFVRRRKDLAFDWMFMLFGIFILACGTTHLMAIWTLWQPVYRLDGVIKATTALASFPTAILLFRLLPQAIALPSPSDLAREVVTRKAAEERLRELNHELEVRVEERTRQLQRYNLALQRVAYIASHDLVEPIRTIVTYNQLLNRRYGSQLDDTGREFLSFSENGAKRLQALVHDLLDYSRMIGQADLLSLQSISPAASIESATANLAGAIRESGASIVVGELPPVLAESVQLQQVFQNLIANAIKYRDASRTPVIRISAERDGANVLIHVADNGAGFDPEYSSYIFEAFRRLHGSDVPGSGVGLAICKTVIESFGGQIWADSQPGQGSTFHIRLSAVQ